MGAGGGCEAALAGVWPPGHTAAVRTNILPAPGGLPLKTHGDCVQVERVPDSRALWSRERGGEDLFWTWTQYYEEVNWFEFDKANLSDPGERCS